MDTIHKFRATFTDGTTGIVPGFQTLNPKRAGRMQQAIERREDVASVKLLRIPMGR